MKCSISSDDKNGRLCHIFCKPCYPRKITRDVVEFERVFITLSISKDVNRQANMSETKKKKRHHVFLFNYIYPSGFKTIFYKFSSDLISKDYLESTQVIWHCISGCSIQNTAFRAVLNIFGVAELHRWKDLLATWEQLKKYERRFSQFLVKLSL